MFKKEAYVFRASNNGKFVLPSVHAYADDTQLYLLFRPSDSLSEVEALAALEYCICDVRAWMREDMLWLNDDKTVVNSWLRCPSIASRLVMLLLHLYLLQGT